MSYADEAIYKDKKDDDLLAMVWDCHQLSLDAFRELREVVWPRDYLFYRSKHDLTMFTRNPQEYPWESAAFMPEVYEQIVTLAPSIVEGALAVFPPARLVPEITDASQEMDHALLQYARNYQEYLNNQLIENVHLRARLVQWVKDVLIYGFKALKVEWYTQLGKRRTTAEDGEGTGRWKVSESKEEVRLKDGIRVRGLPPWHLLLDPHGYSINGENDTQPCGYVQEIGFPSVDALWGHIQATKVKGWKVKSKAELEKYIETSRRAEDWQLKVRADAGQLSSQYTGGTRPSSRYGGKLLHVVTHWEDEWEIVVIGTKGDSMLALKRGLEGRPYQYVGKPFVLLKTDPIDNEPYGESTAERVGGLNHLENMVVNMRFENLKRSLANIVTVDVTKLDINLLQAQVGGFYPVVGNSEGALKVHEWPDVTARAFDEVAFLRQHIEQTGGATSPTMGIGTERYSPTARGTMALLGQSGKRFKAQVGSIGEGLADLCRLIHGINRQYVDKERWIRTTGKGGDLGSKPLTPVEVNQGYEIKFDTRPEVADPAMLLDRMIQGGHILLQMPEHNNQKFIMQFYQLLGMPQPREFLQEQAGDADIENELFLRTGRFPPVHPGDNDSYHLHKHVPLYEEGTAQGMGPQALAELRLHLMDHMRKGGVMGANMQQEGAPEGPPPEGAMMGAGVPPPGVGHGAPGPAGPAPTVGPPPGMESLGRVGG